MTVGGGSAGRSFWLSVALGCLLGVVGFVGCPVLAGIAVPLAVRVARLVPEPQATPARRLTFASPEGPPPPLAWSVGQAQTSKYDGVRLGAFALDGTFYAVNGKSVVALSSQGQERWRTPLGGDSYPDPPRWLTPRSLVVRAARRLVVLDLEGRVLWELAAPNRSEISLLAIGAEGPLAFCVGSGWVRVFSAHGRELWNRRFDPHQVSGLAADDEGHVYVAVEGRLFAFGVRGEPRWKHGDGRAPTSSPQAGPTVLGPDGVLYTTSAWSILAIGRDGVVRWQDVGYGTACATQGLSWVDDGSVLAACHDTVSAYSREGRQEWRFQATGAAVVGAPAVDEAGTVYVASEALRPGSGYEKYGRLSALSSKTGKPSWEIRFEQRVYTTPLVLPDGTVLLGADNRIYAVSAEGRLLWERRLDEREGWSNRVERLQATPFGVAGSADRVFLMPIGQRAGDERWARSGRARTHVWGNAE
jgi:outer membrane protein assembly factor BamB